MNWIAVLGAGREQIPLIQACVKAGRQIVAFDSNPDAPAGGHRFFNISNRDTHRIVGVLAQWPDLRGVICAGTEAAVEVATVAKVLGLPHSLEAAETCRDKLRQRWVLKAFNVPTTKMYAIGAIPVPPVVVKPRFGSGSRAVTLVTELDEKHRRAHIDVYAVQPPEGRQQMALQEAYQSGPQLSTEAIIWDGRCELVAMVDRLYDVERTQPSFVEFGISCPSVHDDAWRIPITEIMARAAEAIGLKRGVLKCDMVLAPDGPKIIECHPRLGPGVLQDCVQRSTGVDYLPEAVRIACGDEPRWELLVASKNEPVAMHINGGVWDWEETRKYVK